MNIQYNTNYSPLFYNKNLNSYFILGICMFCFFTAIIGLRTNEALNKIYELFQIIGLLFVAISLRNFSISFENEYFKVVFYSFILWSILIIVNGMTIDYNSMKKFILGQGIKYFLPFAIFIPQKLNYFKKLFLGITLLGILFLIISFFNASIITTIYDSNVDQKFAFEILAWELAIPSGLILFTYSYHNKKINLFAFIVLILVLLISIYTGRRAYIFLSAIEIIFFFLIYFIETKNKYLIVLSSIFSIITIVTLGSMTINKSIQTRFLGKLQERSMEDTRSTLELALMSQLTNKEWLIGKGINGKYNFSQNLETTDEAGNRDMIEGQILDGILKGGIIYIVLLLLIIVPATIKNLFFSKNLLSKAFGFWLLIFLLSLYPVNYIKFNLTYLMVWIGVAIGYSKSTRMIPDILIRKYFKI